MGTVPRNRTGSQAYDEENLGFGNIFTDHMLQMSFSADKGGWQQPQILPMDNLVLHPATMMLHYGQQVFEGLKAFAGSNEEDIFLFRPDMNIGRFNKSCERLCIPTVDPDLFWTRCPVSSGWIGTGSPGLPAHQFMCVRQ